MYNIYIYIIYNILYICISITASWVDKKCRNIHLMRTIFLGGHFLCLPKHRCFPTEKLRMK